VCAANPNTVIVVVAGAPLDLKTADTSGQAILWSWFNGSEGGNALADVLLGKVNPSGKLPFTFPASLKDSPAHALNAFPGDSTVEYAEGILVGYRWFDTKKVAPLYCFGYGLSYTDFAYDKLSTDKKSYHAGETIRLTLKVKNTGSMDGMETVQLYVSDLAPTVPKAAQELKAFKKVMIPAGKQVEVNMEINASDLSYFDAKGMEWKLTPGTYKLLAGSSSREIRNTCEITIR
jgi:beta-glucosidase